MSDISQPDAPADVFQDAGKSRKGGGNGWRKSSPERAREAVYRWRRKNRSRYNDYQRRYQQARRKARLLLQSD